MIVQTFMVILILSVALICDVTGASYSNVYVESEVVPIGYYSYGTPYPSIANPRLSQINSLPSVSGYVAPCVTPCVYEYPAQTVASVNPVNASPNVLTYNAPSVPIVVAPTKQEATGYEYSYVVYDENTGDHKAQRELSDGSVVRGEYSFLQPDGYVRQVQYVADDISGFNAVVKQFLPAAVEGQRKVAGQDNKESSPPCHEMKNESLKEKESAEKSKVKETKKVVNEESGEESKAESNENQSKKPKQSKEASGEESAETSKEKPRVKPKYSKEESGEESKEKPLAKPKQSKEESGEKSEEKSIEKQNKSNKVSNEDSGEKSEENSKEETHLKKSKESTGESNEKQQKKAKKESKESGEESEEESKERLKDKSRKKISKETEDSREKSKNKSIKGSKEGSDEVSGEKSEEVGQGKNKEVPGLLKPNQEELVPYNDILRCIEAAMSRNYGVPAAVRQEPSPLTYIVLNKPC